MSPRLLQALPALLCAIASYGCDFCRTNLDNPETGGVSGLTAGGALRDLRRRYEGPQDGPAIEKSPADKALDADAAHAPPPKDYRWLNTFAVEYRKWDRVSPHEGLAINLTPGGHIHGLIDEWFLTERIAYAVNDDLTIGLSQTYRVLHQINVEDPLVAGRREGLSGWGDLSLDLHYRFLKQSTRMPCDVAFYADVKAPTGETHKRDPDGELFDAENQPGSGSWDGSFGLSASKRWGTWGASGSIGYSIKGEGEQQFKAGNVIRSTLGMGKLLPWEPCGCKLYGNFGLQDLAEFMGRDHGVADRNHGGQTFYVIPGIAARPTDRIIISASVPVPVYQDLVGTHQHQRFSINFGMGVRF